MFFWLFYAEQDFGRQSPSSFRAPSASRHLFSQNSHVTLKAVAPRQPPIRGHNAYPRRSAEAGKITPWATPRLLCEDGQGKERGHHEVGDVHELIDPQVHGNAA
jgi:hypothetical protein